MVFRYKIKTGQYSYMVVIQNLNSKNKWKKFEKISLASICAQVTSDSFIEKTLDSFSVRYYEDIVSVIKEFNSVDDMMKEYIKNAIKSRRREEAYSKEQNECKNFINNLCTGKWNTLNVEED